MWHRTSSALALGLTLVGAQASVAQQSDVPATLIAQHQWVRLTIVLGRITAETTCSGRSKSAAREQPTLGVRETLNVSLDSGDATVRYELTSGQEHLALTISGGSRVEIVRQPRGDSPAPSIEYRQRKSEPVELIVGRNRYQAASLWHLLLSQEEVCRQHLMPALETLEHSWRLGQEIGALQEALIVLAETGAPSHRNQWAGWVAQLTSDEFRQRRVAARRLREVGQAVLMYFDSLDAATLDAEQRERIAEIRRSVTVRSGDTPRRLATWLIDDPAIWLSLLSHEELVYRQVAAIQLGRIQGRSINFDPQQSKPQRQAQIKRLRRHSIAGN